MGTTNTQPIKHRGNTLPVLNKHFYHLHALTIPSPLRPRTASLRNMSRRQFEEWQQAVRQLQRYNEYLQLPRRYAWKMDCVCSDYGTLQLEYQEGIYTLKQEIAHRATNNFFFEEHELWYMLLMIITLQFNVEQDVKKDYWNIHPKNIVITQQGFLKILLRLNYAKNVAQSGGQEGKDEKEEEEEFVPPEEIPLLLLRLIKTTDERVIMRINKDISETFQLGLTLLSAAQLKDYRFLYSLTPLLSLDIDKLAAQIHQLTLTGKYTEVLNAVIANLSSFNPAERLSGPQLWEWVTAHSEQIKKKGPFHFKYLPKKISNLVALRIKDNQEDLLRNSRIKMKQISESQVREGRSSSSGFKRNPLFEKHLYQPIHQIGRHLPPKHPH